MIVTTNSLLFSQEYIRRLNWIPVSDGSGTLTNIFSGGISNLEHQFIDIDDDDDSDILFLDSDKTFEWYENKGSSASANLVYSFTQIPGVVLSKWFYFVDIDNDGDIDNDTDIDLFLGNVKGGLYLYENTTVTNIDDGNSELPSTFHISAHPNLFNQKVSITVNLELNNRLDKNIFNVLGEKVKTLFNEELNSSTHSFEWNSRNDLNLLLPSGNYIVVVQSGMKVKTLKLTYLN